MKEARVLFNEIMKTDSKEKIKWVCHLYKRPDNMKFLRKLPPTQVLVKPCPKYLEELQKEDNKNYSHYMNPIIIVPLKGSKKKIDFYSNFREDKGLYYFDTQKECENKYNDLIYQLIVENDNKKQQIIKSYNDISNTLKGMFIDSDYLMEKISRG